METTDTSLKIERTFDISIDEMWELWTDPAKISVWHRPDTTNFTTETEAEAHVGGAYKISMKQKDGTNTAFGEFKEIEKPHKLVYSWQWQNDPSNEISEVTVLLDTVPDGTKLTLVHTRLSGPESVKAHAEGWLGCMENLNSLIKGDL